MNMGVTCTIMCKICNYNKNNHNNLWEDGSRVHLNHDVRREHNSQTITTNEQKGYND